MERDSWRVTGGGDAEKGWLIDIHDGARNEVYRPGAGTLEEAMRLAGDSHEEAFHKPVMPDDPAPKRQQDPAEIERLVDERVAQALAQQDEQRAEIERQDAEQKLSAEQARQAELMRAAQEASANQQAASDAAAEIARAPAQLQAAAEPSATATPPAAAPAPSEQPA